IKLVSGWIVPGRTAPVAVADLPAVDLVPHREADARAVLLRRVRRALDPGRVRVEARHELVLQVDAVGVDGAIAPPGPRLGHAGRVPVVVDAVVLRLAVARAGSVTERDRGKAASDAAREAGERRAAKRARDRTYVLAVDCALRVGRVGRVG